MNRQPMPPRRVALARGATPLTRTTGLARRRPQRPAAASKAEGWSQEIREAAQRRSGGRCEIAWRAACTTEATDLHHRQRRREGRHDIANAVAACRACHGYAHAHPSLARHYGWIVPSWDAPEAVPITLRGTRRVLLDPIGGYLPAPTEEKSA